MKTIVWLLRHGDTTGTGILKGMLPFPLSELGKKQIESAGRILSKRKISRIYTSPLARTIETANIVKEFLPEAKIIESKNLIEWDIPEWEGKNMKDLERDFPKEYDNLMHHVTKFKLGERIEKVRDRMLKIFWKAVSENSGKECLLISHGSPIKTLILSMKKLPLDTHGIMPHQGELVRITLNDKSVESIKCFNSKLATSSLQ